MTAIYRSETEVKEVGSRTVLSGSPYLGQMSSFRD